MGLKSLFVLLAIVVVSTFATRTLAKAKAKSHLPLTNLIHQVMNYFREPETMFNGPQSRPVDKEAVLLAMDVYTNTKVGSSVGAWKLTDVFITPPASKTNVYVNDVTKMVAVSYRGSISEVGDLKQTFHDWIMTNANVKKVPCNVGIACGQVSRGVYNEFNNDWAAVSGAIRRNLKAGYQIVVTGHSQGGAIATIASLAVKSTFKAAPYLITFGSPRVGDEQFKNVVNSNINYNLRFVNQFRGLDELVPRVPPVELGFHHVGSKIPLTCTKSGLLVEIQCHLDYPPALGIKG
jgi:hypothetical protein